MRLDHVDVSVAEPCTQSWEAMRGDGRARFCEHCAKTVHNLAEMTPAAVELLAMRMAAGEGVCAQVTKRKDGSLVTLPEPVRGSRIRPVMMSAALAAGMPVAAQTISAAAAAPTNVATSAVASEAGDPDRSAVVTGRLLHPDGTPVESGLVHMAGIGTYVADDRGRFEIHAKPGVYEFILQTGPEQAERVGSVTLHEGMQEFGTVRTRAGQADLIASETYTTGGAVAMSYSWGWKGRLRHPILYARSVVRRMR